MKKSVKANTHSSLRLMNFQELQTGDILIRNKDAFSDHFGLFLKGQDGQDLVAENHRENGVRLVSVEDYLDGKKLIGVNAFDGEEEDRKRVLPLITDLIGHKYDIVKFNCEHFAGKALEAWTPETKTVPVRLQMRWFLRKLVYRFARSTQKVGYGT